MSYERRYKPLKRSDALGDLSDVTITSAAAGDLLMYNGTAWVDATTLTGGYTLTKSYDAGEGALKLSSILPLLDLYETDQGADGKRWRILSNGGVLGIEAGADAGTSGEEVMRFTRSGATAVSAEVRNGAALSVYDSTNTDYIQLSDDGSLSRIVSNNNSIIMEAQGGSAVVAMWSGTNLRVYDSTNTDYIDIGHDGTDILISGVNTGDIQVDQMNLQVHDSSGSVFNANPTAKRVEARQGALFRALDSTNTDYIQLYDNGTDGYVETNTNTITIAAGSNIKLQAGTGLVYVYRNAQNGEFRVYDSVGTDWLGMYVTTTYQRLRHNGSARFIISPDEPSSGATGWGIANDTTHTMEYMGLAASDVVVVGARADTSTSNTRAGVFVDDVANEVGVCSTWGSGEPDFHVYRGGTTLMWFQAGTDDPYFPGHGTTASAANAFLNSSTGELSRSTSSRRYKTNIRPVTTDEAYWVLNAQPVWYNGTSPADDEEEVHIGLIAEDVDAIPGLESLVEYGPAGGKQQYDTEYSYEYPILEDGTPGIPEATAHRVPRFRDMTMVPDAVRYERLSVMLLEVVKDLHKRIELLENRSGNTPVNN